MTDQEKVKICDGTSEKSLFSSSNSQCGPVSLLLYIKKCCKPTLLCKRVLRAYCTTLPWKEQLSFSSCSHYNSLHSTHKITFFSTPITMTASSASCYGYWRIQSNTDSNHMTDEDGVFASSDHQKGLIWLSPVETWGYSRSFRRTSSFFHSISNYRKCSES